MYKPCLIAMHLQSVFRIFNSSVTISIENSVAYVKLLSLVRILSTWLPKMNALRKLIENKVFEWLVVVVIAINAVTLGLETIDTLSPEAKQWIATVDRGFLIFFVVEIVLKMIVYRAKFFADPWRIFDFVVVGISLLPASGPFSIVRSLRVLRTLRMLSVVPSLRKVVNGLLVAIPGLGAVGAILLLIFYVGAVMATKMFGEGFPEWFGTIWASSYSLFQIMTLESWSMGIVRPVMEKYPMAWAFFIPFILVTSFTMLNLFIAVIVNAMHAETEEAAEERSQAGQQERTEMLERLETISQELRDLKSSLQSGER